MASSLIYPILNKSFTTYKGPPWFLSPETSVRTLTTEEYGLIYRDAPVDYKYPLLQRTKRIRIDGLDSTELPDRAVTEYIKISFLFNYFRRSGPLALAAPMHSSTIRKTSFKGIINLDNRSDNKNIMDQPFTLLGGTSKDTLNEFATVLSRVLNQNNLVQITLSRFNTALSKQNKYDRIVDLTISLESLIDGSTELAHRFSAYNAWAAESDPIQREGTYKLLKILYGARSEIVHGGENENKIDKALRSWDDLLLIARNALGYYLLFLYEHTLADWRQHQKNLELGVDARLV